ncbi:MAG TPA: lysophospholipid acyltransferase family protein [Flavipsychrobacter sp.]|nr:lysophospholipid acyltransferase family protein [Flavipsychrobacter sp.]
MAVIIYYIALPFIYLLSALPFPVLYLLSDFFYFILYYGLGYRKDVVLANLHNAFPDKSQVEIKKISKQYYRYLCDLFLETFKTLTISKKKMLRHLYFSPGAKSLFEKLAAENKSIILVMGHLGNWEWAGNSFSLLCNHQLYVIYHPLSNKKFNGLMYHMRTRFGTKLIAMKNTYKDMLANKGELNATAFIADQTPAPENAYWTTFLNQDTPVYKGTEVIARKINYPIVYANVKRVKRGQYEIFAELLVEEPAKTRDGEISELHTRKLEKDIIAQPETWLWSHKRWKHKRPASLQPTISKSTIKA